MLQNFELLKAQLTELAEVVNKFKSEAVQLRLLELVFAGASLSPSPPVDQAPARPTNAVKRRRPRSAGARTSASVSATAKRTTDADSGAPPRAKKAPTGNGAVATLGRIYDSGFFSSPRTLNDIIDHCEVNLARKIKQNEISGKLARMVRAGELKRVKNSDNQYEYTRA